MRKLYLTNAKQRDAMVRMYPVKGRERPKLGLVGKSLRFRKYTAASDDCLHSAMQEKHGEDYGQALVDGDPEVDVEFVGQLLGPSDRVFLSHKGEILHHAPELVEVILNPDGSERERREPVDVASNMTQELPARWTGKRMAKREVVRRFVLSRTLYLQHIDGLTYDYLFEMAKDLHDSDEMMLIGGGAKGKEPVILIPNGSPYRAFLEGRVEGEKYLLLLHLSNMELKAPPSEEAE